MQIGFHIPLSGNLKRMANGVHLSRGNCFQFFSRGARGKDLPNINERQLMQFYNFLFEKKISNIVMHAPYTFNIASENKMVVEKIIEDLNYAKKVLANYYVINAGYSNNNSEQQAFEIIKKQLKEILFQSNWEGEILIRNMSGAGSQLGWHLDSWGELLSFDSRINGALDFSRLFSSGWDFLNKEKSISLLNKLREIGLDKIKVIYINDYNRFCGTKKDDYVPLGEGVIGFHGYQNILEDKVFRDKVWIVENQPTSEHYDKSIKFLVPFFKNLG